MEVNDMRNHHTQRGSTMLGFIAGLVAGLVISVIIAMVVTKSAVPFSQKQSKQGKISEPASADASDPNKPLYSSALAEKDFSKPAAKTAEANETDDEPVPESKSTHSDRAKDVRVYENTIADKTKVRPSNATPAVVKKESHGDDIMAYYLQTNAYSNQAEAQNERAKLALLGLEAKISDTNINGTALFRVRVGPYPNVEAMNKMRSMLTDNGISTAVVPVRKQ
jgi:cell division protein FtsN